MFNYIIVGAGFAGSVIAERIANVLNQKVLIEKRNHIGGHCYDYKDENNIIVHKYGPHLFHTNNKKVFDYLSNFTEWQIYNHKVLGYIDGKKVSLPFNFNTIEQLFPKVLSEKLIAKLLEYFQINTKVPILELKKIQNSDLRFLSDYIYEKVFLNYTAKQWGKKPEEIDPEVTSRVPIFIGRDDRYFNDTYQAVPLFGYTKLFESMLNHKNIKLLLNTDYKEVINIDFQNKKMYLFNNEFNGKLIFTGPIDELFDYTYGVLQYRSLKIVTKTINTAFFQEAATVNYPNNYDFTRITEFKHIHPINSVNTTIMYEYPDEYVQGKTPYYSMFTTEAKMQYEKYFELSQTIKNLFLVGRLAEYRYYDMDDVVEKALNVFEEKIK